MRTLLVSFTFAIAACGPGASHTVPPPQMPVAEPGPPTAEPAPAEPAAMEPAAASEGPLVLDGTPEIPDAVKERMARYLNTRRAGLGDVSDDGKRLLVTTRFAETSQIHIVDGPLGVRYQVSFRQEPSRGPRFWPGRNDVIVYSSDVGGNEQHQILKMNLRTGTTEALTVAGTRNGEYVFSDDGRQLAYMSNRRNGKDFDVWVSGDTAASAKMAVQGKGYYFPLGFSRDGSKLLVREYISVNESRLYVHDLLLGKTERITPDGVAAYRVAVFGRDSDVVYIASDREGEFAELYEVSLKKKTWKPLSRNIPWNVTDAALSGDGRTLAVRVNEGGVSGLYFLNTWSRKLRKIDAVKGRLIGGMAWAKKSGRLALGLVSATMPGDVFQYDPRRRRLVRWTRSELGGLDEGALVEPTLISYPSFDGRKIPAWVYRPKGKGPFPVVIQIHGGPEGQARPYFSAQSQYLLAESKIAVIYPNVRGSDGYGKTYVKLDNGFNREQSVKDIGALLDWIGKQPELDAKRVGVAGGSYGGYMVLASLVHYSDRIAAGIDVVGISNFVTFLQNTADYRRDVRRAEYGDERDPKMLAHLQHISPLNRVDRIRSPLFVAQGANDPRVPASEAQQIVDAVRKTGKDVWYMLAKNEGHGFRKKSNRDTYLQLAILFLTKHLKGQ